MHFKIVGKIRDVEVIARRHGDPRAQAAMEVLWESTLEEVESIARVEFSGGKICQAEVHWYEAHGIGAKEHKIKRIIE